MNDLIYNFLEYPALFLVEWYIFKQFTGISIKSNQFILFGVIYFLASSYCAQFSLPIAPLFFLIIINRFHPNQAPGIRFIQACYPSLVTTYLRKMIYLLILPAINGGHFSISAFNFYTALLSFPFFFSLVKLSAIDFSLIQKLDKAHYRAAAFRSTGLLIAFYLLYLLQMVLHHALPNTFPQAYLDNHFWQLPSFAIYTILILWDLVNLSHQTKKQLAFNIDSEERRHLEDIDYYNHYIFNLLSDKSRYQKNYYSYLENIYKKNQKVHSLRETPFFLHQLDRNILKQLGHIKINIIRNQLHEHLLKMRQQGITLQVNFLADLNHVPISDLEFYQLINFIFHHISACPKRKPIQFHISYFRINNKHIFLFESFTSQQHSDNCFTDIKSSTLKLYPEISNLLARSPQLSMEITKTTEQINYIIEMS